jgi:hypothetical protein
VAGRDLFDAPVKVIAGPGTLGKGAEVGHQHHRPVVPVGLLWSHERFHPAHGADDGRAGSYSVPRTYVSKGKPKKNSDDVDIATLSRFSFRGRDQNQKQRIFRALNT